MTRKHYTCWWGPFVPVQWVRGHLGDVVGLEIVGSRWPGASYVVRLHRRTGVPIRVDAHKTADDAQRAARWLAHTLETQVLNPQDPRATLNIGGRF
ncbi:MAG: hypothetical protein VYE68_15320 [Acidobacteriota bacterium]|nr:hypothetical protein [Acidobacteriota bacterium]